MSNIEWTDKTWSPVTGCTKVSEGCRNCYAERMAKRLKAMGQAKYVNGFEVTTHTKCLDEPLKWKKPRNIFVCSMGDLFHEDVTDDFINDVGRTIGANPQHTFIILTKRAGRMVEVFANIEGLDGGHHDNIIVGVSVEDQKTADERIPYLLRLKAMFPALKIFVSYEPAIEGVDFGAWIDPIGYCCCGESMTCTCDAIYDINGLTVSLDGIIMGGESGPGARPMHPDWARSVRDQCQEAGVKFMFKQWGTWFPRSQWEHNPDLILPDDDFTYGDHRDQMPANLIQIEDEYFHKVTKKKAGCLLDGKVHKELIW